mgnify:CR=1 FL=1
MKMVRNYKNRSNYSKMIDKAERMKPDLIDELEVGTKAYDFVRRVNKVKSVKHRRGLLIRYHELINDVEKQESEIAFEILSGN